MNLQDAKPHSAVLVVALVTLLAPHLGSQKIACSASRRQE